MKQEILRFENVTRQVDGAVYLDNFNFYMTRGEIVGMLSVNDRGKKELLNLLMKRLPIESGRIYWDGGLANSWLDSEYPNNKVYVIDEHSSLIEDLSIADNMFVMRSGFKKYVIEERVLEEQAKRVLESLSMQVDLNQRVSRLTVLERIMIEMAKAYLMGCSLLIVMYPEQLIGQAEFERFHQLLRSIKKKGISTLYFCYHHWIMFQICDRIALFSRGRIKKLFDHRDFTEKAIAPYIYYFKDARIARAGETPSYGLEFRELSGENIGRLNQGIVPGECITFLDSEGRMGRELLKILTKEKTDYEGRVFCKGIDLKKGGRSCLDSGMIVLDNNPTETFLFSEMSYLENLCFLLDRKLRKRILKPSYLSSVRNEYARRVGDVIDAGDIRSLSLKEKYGLVYNKIRLFHPEILVILKPFAYGDMHCRNYILEQIRELKEMGLCILLVTNYITDCLYISDHICILKDGRDVVSLEPEEYGIISRIFS